MKKLLFIFASLILTHARAQKVDSAKSDALLRIWETEEKDGRMQLLKSGDGYYARMLYGKQLLESDGITYKKDIHNPDTALRSRVLKNYTFITGLIYKNDKWVDGKIYNFNDGNSYDVNIELKNGLLYMRVFKGVPMFGKTLKWSPVQ